MTNLPVVGEFFITAIYGQKGEYWASGHKGIDVVSSDKTIYCTCDGMVRNVSFDTGGWGQFVSVDADDGYRHIFCHLVKGSVRVKKGDRVSRLTVLGTMGATGNVTGVHLHYQLQKGSVVIDPTKWLGIPNKKGKYNSKDYELKDGDCMTANDYKDKKEIPEWAFGAVDVATKDGIMCGDEKGRFRPNEPMTRAEFAVVYERMKGKIK